MCAGSKAPSPCVKTMCKTWTGLDSFRLDFGLDSGLIFGLDSGLVFGPDFGLDLLRTITTHNMRSELEYAHYVAFLIADRPREVFI
jgi:hypothetical protein